MNKEKHADKHQSKKGITHGTFEKPSKTISVPLPFPNFSPFTFYFCACCFRSSRPNSFDKKNVLIKNLTN